MKTRPKNPYTFMALLGGSVSNLCRAYAVGEINEADLQSVFRVVTASFTAQAKDPDTRLESLDLIADELETQGFTPQEIATIRDHLLTTPGVVH